MRNELSAERNSHAPHNMNGSVIKTRFMRYDCIGIIHTILQFEFEFLVLNATFSNISAISWRPVLMEEETRVPGKNHRPWAINW